MRRMKTDLIVFVYFVWVSDFSPAVGKEWFLAGEYD
jgi:hypothetical protein